MTSQVSSFRAETFAETRLHELTLRYRIHMDGASASITHEWDDIQLYPWVSFASIHGHNLLPRIEVQLRASTDNFSSSDVLRATFTVQEPSFFVSIDEYAYRWWRIATVGTSTNAIRFGQVVLGQALDLSSSPDQAGLEITEIQPTRESQAVHTGETWRNNITDLENRRFQLNFRMTDANLALFRDEVLRRTSRGLYPMVIATDNPASWLAAHGRGPADFATRLVAYQIQEGGFEFVESPFGASVP
jgi:hypothetical protein